MFRLELAALFIRVMVLAHELPKRDISLSSARGASEVLSFLFGGGGWVGGEGVRPKDNFW